MARQGSGQALVEYVVLLALASVVAVATVSLVGPQLSSAFGQVSAVLTNPMAVVAPAPTPTPTPAAPSVASSESPAPAATPAPSAAVQASPTPTPLAGDDAQRLRPRSRD
jgi:Flp pilus assembly pilin Flp